MSRFVSSRGSTSIWAVPGAWIVPRACSPWRCALRSPRPKRKAPSSTEVGAIAGSAYGTVDASAEFVQRI